MRLSRTILFLTIVIGLLCGQGASASNRGPLAAVSYAHTLHDDEASNIEHNSLEWVLKTATGFSVASRIQERHFVDALFPIYPACRLVTKIAVSTADTKFLAVSHGLKLIYPHHYFW